jgi:hypothetical protein
VSKICRCFLAVLGAVAALSWAAPAIADSGLTMNFACQVNRGKVELSPSPPRTYRVYGAPESRMFSNCAPGMPGGCPSLKLQRFDLDCGGARVSWIAVAEALTRYTNNPGYVSDGRFHMMAAPAFRASPGPCGPSAPFGYPPRRMGPYPYAPPAPCVVPYPSRPRQSMELPEGFAPPMARFAQLVAAPAIPLPTPKSQAPNVPDAAPSSEGTDPTATGSVPQAKPKPAPVPETPPKIVKPAPTQVATAEQPNAAAKGSQAMSEQPKTPSPELTSSISAASLLKGWAPQIGFILIALSLVSTSLYFSFRRGPATGLATFVGSGLARMEPAPRDGIMVPPTPQSTPPSRSSGFAQGRARPTQEPRPTPAPSIDEWLPTSRAEALRMLGAAPDAGKDTLKRLVKRLRQTWHPDRAKHEDDRRMREIRLKQINVAWDILSGKRA